MDPMRKTLDEKVYRPIQDASDRVAMAAEAQAMLMVALTAVSVTALIVAAVLMAKECNHAGK